MSNTTPCNYGECPYDAMYSEHCRVYCGLGVDEACDEDEMEELVMETVYLEDITGTIGEWLDADFDDCVPKEVIKLLTRAYELAVKEYEH